VSARRPPPRSPVDGQTYHNTTDGRDYTYSAARAMWEPALAAPPAAGSVVTPYRARCPVCEEEHAFRTRGDRMRRLITWECRIRDLVVAALKHGASWTDWELPDDAAPR
jgi:hypothetical protein